MRALSLHAGWAWGLIFLDKRIENRSWKTSHRGPLAIHAGRSRASQAAARRLMPDLPPDECISWGTIIGVVDLVDVVPLAQVAEDRFAEGPWCWITANPRPLLLPFHFAGQQRLFEVPDKLFEGRFELPSKAQR